ncbi:MAG: hypothetical protein JXR73_07925 [Candidatus Omnitrophica bacterium]|nr:hypothetical protein [Candidatus Omnitrophota bacterium]
MIYHRVHLFIIFSCCVYIFSGTALGMVFEDRCQTSDQWTFLDYTGNLQTEIVKDLSCPPGYGPDVLRIHGDVAMGLALAPPLQEGSFIALYKEETPAVYDADGVIMVWAQYDRDTSTEHNAKIMKSHVWLEQDNDLGIQFRVIDAKGKEYPVEERVGVGLVTDPWNQTNWIWQKVQIKENRLRAKFWPAEKDEPDEWAIETQYNAKGNRYGLRINSGSIRVAYFAADTQDIHPKTPPVYLFSSLERIPNPNRIPLTLFTNSQKQRQETFHLIFHCDGELTEKSEFVLDIPKGHHAFPILLTADHSNTQSKAPRQDIVISIPQMPSSGMCRVTLSNETGDISTYRSFEIINSSKLLDRFKDAKEFLSGLDRAIQPLSPNTECAKSLRVIVDAANAHLKRAMALLDMGKNNESESSFRFVMEALSELHGYKGRCLEDLGINLHLDFIPHDFEDNRRIEDPKNSVVDFYTPNYRIFFHQPKSRTRSMVMGRSYEIEIPWSVAGEPIDRDFNFNVRLVSPLGNRIVAQSNTPPEIPTHLWKPGELYVQHITMDVLAEDAVKRPSEPLVLDERHNLLVTVTDPKSGATLLLGNTPGDQVDRVGSSFLADRFYVSSTPLEIFDFDMDAAHISVNDSHRIIAALRNVGDESISIDAVITVTAESGRILFQKLQSVRIHPNSDEKVECVWPVKSVGKHAVVLRLMRRGILVTESLRELIVKPPPDHSIDIEKQNHVEKRGGRYVTPIAITAQPSENSVTVRVYAGNRLVGEAAKQAARIEVEAEPWFGYYDIQVDCSRFSYEQRIVATVVETKGKDLLVNGEPFIVKGVNVHGLDAGSPERTASMMRIMRDLGFNAWRGDYPARWQMELAYRLNSVYTVLAPFSCTKTSGIFARQSGPPLGTARELTRLFIDRYKDSAGVLLWNSCNEIVGENVDFLLSLYPLYKVYDPYQRPVHYANLYGQDLWQGQDLMGVNYYFGEGQSAIDRQILIQRSVDLAFSHSMPILFCEYNSYYGAIHSTGVEAIEGLFSWGVEQAGMAGGFLYMRPNSSSHPGVMDSSYNTHKIFNDAIIETFADARIELASTSGSGFHIHIKNKRNCTLRQIKIHYCINNIECDPIVLDDLPPKESVFYTLPIPENCVGPDWIITGYLEFVTHYGFQNKVPFTLLARI